jgi:hypothetical protein
MSRAVARSVSRAVALPESRCRRWYRAGHTSTICRDDLAVQHRTSLRGSLALSADTRASTTFAFSTPKHFGAEGRGLTPVARRAQAP